MFMKICNEYGVSNDLMKWRNQGYFTTWQSKTWQTGRPAHHIQMTTHSPDGLLRNRMI